MEHRGRLERRQLRSGGQRGCVGRAGDSISTAAEAAGAQRLGIFAGFGSGAGYRAARAGLIALLAAAAAAGGVVHPSDKLTDDEKIALVRDLSSEYAKAKTVLPRSAKALEFNADGTWDKGKWQQASLANGAAARLGDQVQITKVTLDGDKILFEINGGLKSGRHWYDPRAGRHGYDASVSNDPAHPTEGTNIELDFHKPMESLTPDEVKKLLAPLLDFDKRSATKMYSETLSPENAEGDYREACACRHGSR